LSEKIWHHLLLVFRKRGGLKNNELFYHEGKHLDIVDSFNYLGTIFTYTGSFSLNQEHLIGKAHKALNVLLINCNIHKLKPKVLCQLFDSHQMCP
jgi:hypothetical protein